MSRLSKQRRFIHPESNDNWGTIALRELPGMSPEQAISELQSWNLHVFMKAGGADAKEILPCDIVFLEPPQA